MTGLANGLDRIGQGQGADWTKEGGGALDSGQEGGHGGLAATARA